MTMIASVTPGQKESFVRLVTDSLRKNAVENASEVLGELERRGVIRGGNFQRVIAQGDKVTDYVNKKFAEALSVIVAELAENIVGCLRLISGEKSVVIAATDGQETLAEAIDVFAYIDSDFENYGCDVKSGPTAATEVNVYEMIKDSTFAQIFGGFGENLDRLCLTQAQIKAFVRSQDKWLLSTWGTFFLFKVGEKFFVASVYVDSGGLLVYVDRFLTDHVWLVEHEPRFVVPQLTSKA